MYIGLQLNLITVYNNFIHIYRTLSHLSKPSATCSKICHQLALLANAFH